VLDVRNELEDLKEALSTGELQASEAGVSTERRASRSRTLAGAVVLLVAGAVLGSLFGPGSRSSESNVPRLTNPVQVTSAIGVENHPTWSPEGGRIAYMSDQSGNLDIWVSQVSGGPPVNLTEDFTGRDSDPSWSPDGGQIGFKSDRDGGGCFVMSALGGTPRRILSQATLGPPGTESVSLRSGSRPLPMSRTRPAWSPDGSKIACPDVDEEGPLVDIVTLTTQEVERARLQGQYSAMNLTWSPDGRFFAYVDAIDITAETTRLWIVSLSGESIPLTDGTTEVWSPDWSQDGKSLFYVTNRGGSKDLWMQALNEDATPQREPEAVTTGLGIQSASFLADGTRMAYSKGGRFANVWRVPILPDRAAAWSDAEQLTFDQAFVEFVDLSPDARRLVVSSNRGGFLDLWTLPAEGGEMQPLTNDPAPDWSPSWSQDGKEIAFYSSRVGNRDIFAIPSDGGPVRQLTTHTGGDIMPFWSPDGQRIAYTSVRGGNYDIWVMSATGDEQTRLTEYGGEDNVPAWSPNGRWIAFASSRDGGGLWRVGASGGEPERLTDQDGFLPRWSPDGETIYFLGGFGGNELWAIYLEDRVERVVADLSGKPGILGNYALATDGQYLYFTWEETLGDIWVMDVVTDESE